MKVAVIGDGPWAMQQARTIDEMGGHSVVFDLNPKSYTTLEGLSGLEESLLSSLAQYRQYLIEDRRYFTERLLRVTKRFLLCGEAPKSGSRFMDLFRVVIERKTKETLLKSTENVSEEILNSLKEEIEVYFDFDLVIDCQSGVREHEYTGGNTPTVGETRLQNDRRLRTGFKILSQRATSETVVLVGDGPLSGQFLIDNRQFIQEKKSTFFWVSSYENPIFQVQKYLNKEQISQFDDLMNQLDSDYDKQKSEFRDRKREWEELESYERVKIPEPPHPIPMINIFSGHTVTAFNKLIDQEEIFISIEKPDFRDSHVQPENSSLVSKTLSAKEVFISSRPARQIDIYHSLEILHRPGAQPEKGAFFFSLVDEKDRWVEEQTLLQTCLSEWFSPAQATQ